MNDGGRWFAIWVWNLWILGMLVYLFFRCLR